MASDPQRIDELFLEAADLPRAERAAFLDRVCAGDPAAREEIESLLRADTDGAGIRAAVESEAAVFLGGTSLIGTRLGAYRLLQEVGRGGMGSVYRAERDDDQYKKSVAVKVVRRGMDTDEVLGRFRHERQILAGLEHPNIARLLDGGTTPDGRPYFVMEYILGQPIDVYCRERLLDVSAKLRLFLQVCEAVSYAHQSLIVHRDLKPGNILVTADGVPKLLDFGVAKLLSPGADPGFTATALPSGPLTPEYASPEQVRGLPVTTASDVYALGVVLYELLTGRRAQPMQTRTPEEIDRVVCETQLARPGLDEDLDNIVLMATRKERERRYRSVDEFSADIGRFLERRPVMARQDSLGYRAKKFVSRHRLPIAAAALVAVSLVAGTTVALLQAREAQAQRATAERRLSNMIELANRSLYDVHAAIEKLPGATEARRQIVTTTLKLLEDLSKDAGHDDRLQFVLSVSYSKVADVLGSPTVPNLGDSAGAVANYDRSIALIDPLLAKEPDRIEYITQWVDAQESRAVVMAAHGERAEAVKALHHALPVAQKLSARCPTEMKCVNPEGTIYSAMVESYETSDSLASLTAGRNQTALYERTLKAMPDNPEVQRELATAYSQEAKLWNARGELAQAADRYQHAVTLREQIVARNPTDVLLRRSLMITYGNLGGNLGSPFYHNLGDTAGARTYYGKALAIARELASADAKNQLAQYDLANALIFTATLDMPKDELPASLEMLKEADTIMQKVIAADPGSASKLRPLAMSAEYQGRRLEAMGRDRDAIVQYRRSMAVAEQALTKSAADLSFISQALATQEAVAAALSRLGDHAAAREEARAAVARADRVTSSASDKERVTDFVSTAYLTLAGVEADAGSWPAARAAAERAVAGYRALVSAGSLRVNKANAARAETLLRTCQAHS